MKKEIKSAEEIIGGFKGSNEYPQLITRHEAELACEEYAAQFKQEWVPVEKELPPVCQTIHTWSEKTGIMTRYFSKTHESYTADEWRASRVTHWQPLPEPPTI